MALIAPVKPAKTDFKLTPAGTHLARIDQIIDLGIHKTTFKDEKGDFKFARRISFRLEIPNQKLDDGTVMVNYKDFTFNLGTLGVKEEKYKPDLRKNIESLLGRHLTNDEVSNFDVETLLGEVALIQIAHVPLVKDPTKKFATITGMMKAPDGMPVPEPVNKPLVFSTEDFNKEIYDLLPEWVQKKIALPPGIDLNASTNVVNKTTTELLA